LHHLSSFRDFRLWRFAPVGVLVLFAVSAIYLSAILLRDQRDIGRSFQFDVTSVTSQALVKSLRLQVALTELEMSAGRGDPTEAQLRYDILVSQVRTLQSGYTTRLFANNPALLPPEKAFFSAVEAAGLLMPSIQQPGVPARIIGLLRPMDGPLFNLAALAYSVESNLATTSEQRLGRDHWRLTGLLAALVAYGVLLVGLLFRRNRLLSKAHVTLREFADSLRQKGDELTVANHAVRVANAELSVRNAHFHAALENMSQGLCMVDADQRLIVCNRPFVTMFHLEPATAVPGTALGALAFTPALRDEHLRLSEQRRPAAFVYEPAGERALAVSHRPLPDGGWVATYEDVTERRRTEARIAYIAHHDELTGLPNRTQYRQRIEEVLALPRGSDEKLSVLLLDLDHFKEVNDSLGHSAGDALLEVVARRLRACTRAADLVARLGGDEFVVIPEYTHSAREASRLAERIVQAIGEPYEIDSKRVLVSVSIGIAVEPAAGASAELLLKYADMALYQAKANGRATWCFYEPEMDQKVQMRRAMSADLADALRLGQLEVHYQPVIDLARRRVAGFEALLRWRHPERGLVPPMQFIPLAEETGLITVIGEWVLRQACLEATTWPDHVRIAVNLSPRQFHGSNVALMVEAVLDQTGLDPGRLELEITESLLLQDGDDVLAALRELRALGVGVVLDDFGTGYASLSYLRKFPFTKLKIDQTFVRGMELRDDCIIIIDAVAAMARRLGMMVTAEGIETEEQLAIVRDAGCNLGQGYLFGRPAPSMEATRLIARNLDQDAEPQLAG